MVVDKTLELKARRMLASSFAQAFANPGSSQAKRNPVSASTLVAAWELSRTSYHPDAFAPHELDPFGISIEPLAEWLHAPSSERDGVHRRTFGLVVSKTCPPYETEYCEWKDPTHRAQRMADISGFYAAFGLEPNRHHPERHDHLSLELEYVSFILEKLDRLSNGDAQSEEREVCTAALKSFVRDHIVWWVPTFAKALEMTLQIARTVGLTPMTSMDDTFLKVAQSLAAWVSIERSASDLGPSCETAAPRVSEPDTSDACHSCVGEP